MNITAHASKRMQQRGVPPLIVAWLKEYGDSEYAPDGTQIRYFTKRSLQKLEGVVGRSVTRRLHEQFDAYAVMDGDLIITVGARYKRIKRK